MVFSSPATPRGHRHGAGGVLELPDIDMSLPVHLQQKGAGVLQQRLPADYI
jgi:hypothetical protein